MNVEEYTRLIQNSFIRRFEIYKKKSHDYASQTEVLGNFKRVAGILRLLDIDLATPSSVAVIYIVLKLDRFCNLVYSGKKPKNEAVQDTIDDLKNYCDLMEACYADEQSANKEAD